MDFPAVYQTHDRRTCIVVGTDDKNNVVFVKSEEGITDLKKLPVKEFDRDFTEIPNYPILRAARLYLNPLSAAIEITPAARKALNKIVNEAPSTTKESTEMNEIEASTVQAQKNVNATVKAGLRTGTREGDVKKAAKVERATKPAPEAAKTATPTNRKTKEKTVSNNETDKKTKPAPITKAKPVAKKAAAKKAPAKKAAAPAKKAPAKKAAAPAKKPAAKGGAAKLVKKGAKPAAKKGGKAQAKKASTGERTTGGTIIKVNPKNERVLKNGAVKTLFDFVASKGAKGVARDDAYTHMLKHDKEEGADQRTRYNISWCLYKGIFIKA